MAPLVLFAETPPPRLRPETAGSLDWVSANLCHLIICLSVCLLYRNADSFLQPQSGTWMWEMHDE